MGAKRYGDEYTGRFNTREEYLTHLDTLSERYHTDEEFRESMKKRSRNRYDTIMGNKFLHDKECARRRDYYREYMREYNKKKREKQMSQSVSIEQKTSAD